MAFRTKAAIGAVVAMASVSLYGEPASVTVTVAHRHIRHSMAGELRVSDTSIAFTEPGKHADHSRVWKYEQIQQLRLSERELQVLTYEDAALGRDREYVFDNLPEGFAKTAYAVWKDKLDQRFVAAIADSSVQTLTEFPAKLLALTRGVEGTLRFADDCIVFSTKKAGESRTWRLADIGNIASAGAFDFSLTTMEHHGAWNTGAREFRFQLQRPMEEARFNELWRKLNAR